MSDWLTRQTFLGKSSDEVFASRRVGLIGLGGGGSHIAQQLAHLGVGNFTLLDPDYVEFSNLNRLVGATAKDAQRKRAKTRVFSQLIKKINPSARITAVPKQWQEESLLLGSCDVVFGSVDTYVAREQIERACRRFLIPYIDIGMDVWELSAGYVLSGQMILSMPDGPCLRCFGFLNDDLLAQEAARYGAAGGRPQVVWPNGILASAAVGTFVQLTTPWEKGAHPATYLEYDGNAQTLMPSNRLNYCNDIECVHFRAPGDLGDPFWPQRRAD
jgi:molybdopterin/thiamine biosynthesis adenylyltransferase